MSGHTVPIQFVRSALASAESRGLDVKKALWDAQISTELVYRDASRVTIEQATAVIQSMWRATDDELLGLGPKPVPRGTFRMISLALIHAPDLRTALTRLCEFALITTGFPLAVLTEDEHHAQIEIGGSNAHAMEPLAAEIAISIVQRFAAWLIGKRIRLAALELPSQPPDHVDEYDLVFGCVPVFGSDRIAMTFDVKYLSAPIVRGEPELLAFLKSSPADLLFRRDYGSTTSDRVRKTLERGRQGRWQPADEVAARLAISTQHLRRLLHEEGTSFRQIKEEILRDAAIASLVGGQETVEDLSARLGFSETSAFRRAFRRWTGSPPGAYRPHDSKDEDKTGS